MKKLIFLLIFSTLVCSQANAVLKTPSWQDAGWSGGGQYTDITPDSQIHNRIYLSSDVTGRFYSKDGADHWLWMNGGSGAQYNAVTSSFAQDPTNPNILWSLGEYMIKSTDRGTTWVQKDNSDATRPNVHKAIAINPTNGNDVVYGNDDGSLRRTTDGGDNWTTYGNPLSQAVSYASFSPDGSRLFVGSLTGGMGYYDIDATDTWHAITLTGTNATRNRDYCQYTKTGVKHWCVTAGTKVACTTDQGSTWTYTSDTGIGSGSYMWRLACSVDGSNNVRFYMSYVSTSSTYTGSEKVSSDGGETWSGADSNYTLDATNNPTRNWVTYTNPARGLAIDPFDPNTLYKHDDWGVFKSTDFGSTWTEKIDGAQDIVATDLALAPNNRLFATAMDNGVMYSDDWGDTWHAAFPDGTTYGFNQAGHVWQVVVMGDAAAWAGGTGKVVATSSYWTDLHPRIIYSSDNGATWTVTTTGLPTVNIPNGNWGTGYPRALTVDPQDSSILYLGIDGYTGTEDGGATDGGLFKSTDYGATWSRVNQPPHWNFYNCLQVSPSDQNTLFFGTFVNSSYYTANGGSSYAQRTGISYVYDCVADSTGRIYVGGNASGPYMMTSSTMTGSLSLYYDPAGLTGGEIDGIALDPGSSETMAFGTYLSPHIWITRNRTSGSPAFEDITYDLPAMDGINELIFADDCGTNGCLFAATNGAGIFKLDFQQEDGTTGEGMGVSGVGVQ